VSDLVIYLAILSILFLKRFTVETRNVKYYPHTGRPKDATNKEKE